MWHLHTHTHTHTIYIYIERERIRTVQIKENKYGISQVVNAIKEIN